MSFFRFRPTANKELWKIVMSIADENPPAAFNLLLDMTRRCQFLADYPHNGRATGNYRIYPMKPYLIQFRGIRGGVEITRVVDGRRDPKKLKLDPAFIGKSKKR